MQRAGMATNAQHAGTKMSFRPSIATNPSIQPQSVNQSAANDTPE